MLVQHCRHWGRVIDILAREGLRQWIMKSRWKSNGGKMKREWRSQSEREEPIPRDNSIRRLE